MNTTINILIKYHTAFRDFEKRLLHFFFFTSSVVAKIIIKITAISTFNEEKKKTVEIRFIRLSATILSVMCVNN